MKKGMNHRLKLGFAIMLTIGTFSINAQSANWTISKDVQRVANKKALANDEFNNTHIQANSVSPTWMISKGVSKNQIKQTEPGSDNITSKGYPHWTISKGVQRINRK